MKFFIAGALWALCMVPIFCLCITSKRADEAAFEQDQARHDDWLERNIR